MKKPNLDKKAIAIGTLISVLDDDGSSHENLLDAVYLCVKVWRWCSKEEFIMACEEYRTFKKIRN